MKNPLHSTLIAGALGLAGLSITVWARHSGPLVPSIPSIPLTPSHRRSFRRTRLASQPPAPAQHDTPGSVHTTATPGTALTSYEAVSGNPAPAVPIATAAVPWQPGATWAVAPLAVHHTLWFGEEQTPHGPWTWIPSTLPGALSPALPIPVAHALAWAFDLHAGQPGPILPGPVSWASVAGRTGVPAGWTLASVAYPHAKMLGITVWEPSYTGAFHGFYGVETQWNGHNQQTGTQALVMIEPDRFSLSQIAASSGGGL